MTLQRIEAWKSKVTKESVIDWFTKSDHFKVGLDNGGTVNQIMEDLGFKNPDGDPLVDILGKYHIRAVMHMARKYFYRSGFILSSKKFNQGTPTVYFLIDNLSEERVNRHYKIKRKAEIVTHSFRNDKLDLLQLIDRVKDDKTRESFKKAYSSKLNMDQTLLKKRTIHFLSTESKRPPKIGKVLKAAKK